MMRKGIVAAFVLVSLVVSGCGLLGVSTRPDPKAEVEATLHLLAAAAERKDIETLKAHLAEEIIAQVAEKGEMAPAGADPLDRDALVNLIESVWANAHVHELTITVDTIHLQGDSAFTQGAFVLHFADSAGTASQCVGTGTVHFVRSANDWVIAQIDVSEVSCTLTIPGTDPDTPPAEPGDDKPGDDETPGQPGDDPSPGDNEPPLPGGPFASFDICHYLVLGSQGDQVVFLQEVLAHLGYYRGRIDGDFGPMTDSAVKSFQKDHGLYVDGEVGPKTIAELHRVMADWNGYYDCGAIDDRPRAGETFLAVTTLRPGTSYETPVYTYESPVPGPTLVFIGCIHGNERSGHLALTEAIDRGITISRGRVVIVPEFNKKGCERNTRTYNGYDFNRQFPVGGTPTLAVARALWDLIRTQPNLAFVVDFHDGFNNSLANTLIHTRQSEAGRVARKLRDALNDIRPSNSSRPKWRAMTEPIGGSVTRKVGRDLNTPAMIVELAGRTNPDPLSLRKTYAWTIMKMIGSEYGITILF